MLKKVRNTLIALIAVVLFSFSFSSAQAKSLYFACGLGGLIGSQIGGSAGNILALITNLTFDLGTTATSSQVTSEDSCANAGDIILFVHMSYENLEKDIANGEGEYLDALTTLAVEDDTSKQAYTQQLRTEFSKIVADENYTQLSRKEKVRRLFEIAI